MRSRSSQFYPKPGPTGGTLLRRVIGDLRRQGLVLPLDSHILIATSGGSDSIALAHLLIRYGRRIAAKERLTLLHINHGWRGEESDVDEELVTRYAQDWGVPLIAHRLKPSLKSKGSLEDQARNARKTVFAQEAEKCDAVVITAHHAEDLAETLLWRLFTGAAKTHGGGIAYRDGCELRPLLQVRKRTLQAYLQEEEVSWREDKTNHQGRFLRSKMRQELLPVIEKLFPRAVEHLMQLALESQSSTELNVPMESLSALFGAAGLRVRRSHWQNLLKKSPGESGEIFLPDGWRLTGSSDHWLLQKRSPKS